MTAILFLIYLIFSLIVLYHGMKSMIWEIGSVVFLLLATIVLGIPWILTIILWSIIMIIILIIRVEPVRNVIAQSCYQRAIHSVPKLTKTEEEALNAGDTWLEQDIFRGSPNWDRLAEINSELTSEEQAFLDNETENLCAMLDEWTITKEQDLPKNVLDFLKENGFFGLVIAREFGGRGFSARAHSDVVMKIASRSGVAAVTVMVPNSLGPGELLHFYGTDEQKNNYLPKLAKGLEIPCFALTEPGAGSDATSIQSQATVIKRMVNGEEVLGLLINNLNKRWITLAPIATLIGLAVQLKDPDKLLKGNGQEGITCVLIPRDTENLEIGNRHLPTGQYFMNGTIRGENIFVPITSIIGGQKNAGHGWQMLVECLSIGRAISLPALAAGTSSTLYLATSAFARIRRQFHVELHQFEGVEEKLAEMAGLTYIVTATRLLTLAAVNEHKKPSTASAITKYFNTELARIVINDAMDIHGGRAVVAGPRNYLSGAYLGLPITITVEGANIMTRNLLIFGQGSMACHPYLREEFYAITRKDKDAFKELLWKHIQYFLTNSAKAVISAWTGGLFIHTPKSHLSREYKRLARLSHAFAFLADASLIYLGGELKRKERISARLADGLSFLYLAMAVLRNCQQQNEDADELAHAKWALAYCFYHAEKALISLCHNFPSRTFGILLRLKAFPFGSTMRYPSDKLSHNLVKIMTGNNHFRDTIKKSLYLSGDSKEPVDKVENALQLIIKHADLSAKVSDLKRYSFGALKEQLLQKVSKGELTQAEMEALIEVERARWDAIQVDEFSLDSVKKKTYVSLANSFPNPLD